MNRKGQAGDEIEITEEMVRAGEAAYLDWEHDNWERAAVNANANLVTRVFIAMHAARRPSL